MKIQTRLATPADVPIIALLGRITFGETFGHLFHDQQDLLDYFDDTFSVEKIEASLSKSTNVFWISFVNRLPVAYAKLKLDSPTSFIASDNICQLQKIYVLKDFLSLKIGYQLQHILIEKAKELDYDHIWLSVLKSNERAIRFYKKFNFNPIGTHDFTIGKQTFNFFALSLQLNA
ncbi:MAG: GNAT family N-acetyltransferase [Bacteroidota bacterium]